MRIALFSHDFPPVNRIGAMRAFSFAKTWVRDGNDVQIFTVKPVAGAAPLGSLDDFPELRHLAVHSISFFGSIDSSTRPDLGRSTSGNQIAEHLKGWKSSLRRVWRKVGKDLPIGFFRDPGLLSLFAAWRAVADQHRIKPFDVIVTSFPTPAAHLLGFLVKSTCKIPWIADYRDLWSGGHLYAAIQPFFIIQEIFERFLIKDANLVVVINDIHRKIISQNTDSPIFIASNGFDEDDYSPSPPLVNHVKGVEPARLVYTGTIFGKHRFPTILLDVLDELKVESADLSTRIHVHFYSSDAVELGNEIARRRLSDLITIHQHVGRKQIVQIQRQADALLFCDWSSPEDPGHMSGKIFEYLGAQRPIISIGGRSDSLPSQLILECQAGVCCWNDHDKLKATLDLLGSKTGIPYVVNELIRNRYTRRSIADSLMVRIKELSEGVTS